MSLGQTTEIFALSFLPFVLDRLGRQRTLALGASAWVAYHGLFAMGPGLGLALAIIPLNGFAIAFFHVVAPMTLDEQAPPDRRAGVQGLWVMAGGGLGSLAGGLLAGEVMERAAGEWHLVFAVPAVLALAAVVLIVVGLRAGSLGAKPVASARAVDWGEASEPALTSTSA